MSSTQNLDIFLDYREEKRKYRINYSKTYFRDNVFCYASRLACCSIRRKKIKSVSYYYTSSRYF